VEQPKHRKWIHLILVGIIFAVFAIAARYYFSLYDEFNQENLRAFIAGFGPWAPLAYAAVYVISSPIPFLAPVISATGGFLFGLIGGTIIVLIVASLSALVPFMMARQLGREWVEGKIKGNTRFEEIYRQSQGEGGFIFIMLMRLIPVLPWEVQNYVGGLTKVSIPIFLAGTVVGIIPGSFSLVFLGAAATDPTSWQFVVAIALKIVTALIPVVYLTVKSRRNKK
jgi:uncharacterized membrane protein YdjX (TVP38/TMEM64 family)